MFNYFTNALHGFSKNYKKNTLKVSINVIGTYEFMAVSF